MWWNVKNGSSKELANQEGYASGPLDDMVQQISRDLSNMMDQEQQQVKAQLAQTAREWCMKDLNHDLRTPLNAIIGFTQMMENGTLGNIENPQYLEYLRHIRESGYQLLGKFEALMDTIPGEEGKFSSLHITEREEAVA